MNIDKPYIEDQQIKEQLWNSMKGKLKYSLLNDFLIKYSFQKDLYALKGLLSAILHLKLDSITSIEILNPIMPGQALGDKDCILDILLELNHSTRINIEIQTSFQDFWPERSITYLCKNFDHLASGQDYSEVKQCIQIGILEKELFKEGDARYTGKFLSEYILSEKDAHTEYSSKFKIIVVSLIHLENASNEDKEDSNGLYYWAKLFKATTWEEIKKLAEEDSRMESFVGTVKQLSEEEEIEQALDRRLKYMLEKNTYEAIIRKGENKLEEMNRTINSQQKEIDEKQHQIDEKQHQIEELEAELRRLKQNID